MRATLSLLLLLLAATPASAGKKAGVTLPDAVDVAGKRLVLNGMGVREATMFNVDVYVAGLYLTEKTSSAQKILAADAPWRITMKFVRDVEREKLTEAWREGFGGKHRAAVGTLVGYMSDVDEGDAMVFTYVPGAGTTVEVKGAEKGVIRGADFAKALLSVWLGPKPPNAGLKKGMLGG